MGILNLLKSALDALAKTNIPTPVVDMPKVAEVIIDNSTRDVYTYHIADLAEKYETSNKGPGYISNGAAWGDPGGDSYGSYQIETKKGTMAEYLRTKDMFTKELNKYTMNSKEFKQCWTNLAKQYPEQFQQSQFDFLCKKPNGYNDAIAYAKKTGFSADNFAVQSAVFSTSNQSGGWKKIFDAAQIKVTDTIATQLTKLYTARAKYFKSLSLTANIKTNIMKQRCGFNLDMTLYSGANERVDCLNLARK